MHEEWSCPVCGRPRCAADEERGLHGLDPLTIDAEACGPACVGTLVERLTEEAKAKLRLLQQRLGIEPPSERDDLEAEQFWRVGVARRARP
jgi:hypothetical protein